MSIDDLNKLYEKHSNNNEGVFLMSENQDNEIVLKNAITKYLLDTGNATNFDINGPINNILLKINNKEIILSDIYGLERKGSFMYIYLGDKSKAFIINLDDYNDTGVIEYIPIFKKKHEKSEINQLEKKVENISAAMDEIYGNNYFELDRQSWFENGKDIVKTNKYGKELKGKNMRQLKELLDINQRELSVKYSIIGDTKGNIVAYEKRLAYLFGIGDKYEAGASYFNMFSEQNDKEAKAEIKRLLGKKTLDESLNYLSEVHEQIHMNQKQSDIVEKSYTYFTNELHEQIFERLKKGEGKIKTPDELFLKFARITTGRESNIDDNYRSPEYANKAITYIVYRDGGIMEDISNSPEFQIEDERLKGRSPIQVISELSTKLDNIYEHDVWKRYFTRMGLGKIFETKELDYKNLSFDDKVYISMLVRISDKLTPPRRVGHQKRMYGKKIKIGGKFKDLKDFTEDDLKILIADIGKEGFETVIESLNDNLGAKWNDLDGADASDFKIKKGTTEEKVFNLYQEINGNGAFDIADDSWETWKSGGKFAAVIGTVIITGGIAGTVIGGASLATIGGQAILGGAMGFAGTTITVAMDSKGYETFRDGAWDIGTDYMIGTGTGYIGGLGSYYILNKAGALEISSYLSKKGLQNIGVTAVDIGILGFGAEIYRNNYISDKVISDRNNDNVYIAK